MTNKLRNVQVKEKGFHCLSTTDNKHDMETILNYVMSSIKKGGFSLEDGRILDKVCKSYKKIISGAELSSDDFILSGHEINEFSLLDNCDHVRYFVYRYKYNKYPELKISDEYPPCIQIEPASVCNYRCIMCYQVDKSFSNKSSGHMGYMSLDAYKNIIDQIEGNVDAVTLASRGEPLLNKDISKMIEYSSGKFLGFKINTNASLLTEKMSHTILDNLENGTIVFSVDAAEKELYEKIRVNGSFEKVLKNIARFKEIKERYYSQSRIITRVSGVMLNEKQKIDQMENTWLQFVDQTGFTNYTPWHSSYSNEINTTTSPCTELWRRMFIWHDGIVNPCDYDYKSTLSVGNINSSTVSELWNSEKYISLRNTHKKNGRALLNPCNRCPMK